MKSYSKILLVSAAILALLSCSKENPQSGDESAMPVPALVDLGLSVKWGSFNLGATKPEEYGGYYQWAGTQDGRNRNLNISNCPYHWGWDHELSWTKYISSQFPGMWSGPGKPDNKVNLDPEDDAAHVHLGGSWRIPKDEEWRELIANCTWTWTNLNGVNGYLVTGKKEGYKDKSIFIPAAGRRMDDKTLYSGTDGYYWTSVLYIHYPVWAREMRFDAKNVEKYASRDREVGLPIRPVSK